MGPTRMRKLTRLAARVVAATILGAALTACGSDAGEGAGGDASGTDDQMIQYDERISATIVQLSRRGESRRLADLTNFAWDTVYAYSEGATAKQVNDDAGTEVLRDKRFYTAGNLFVFMRDGTVHRALTATPDLVTWDGSHRFGPDVELVPLRPGKSSGLRLEEPENAKP